MIVDSEHITIWRVKIAFADEALSDLLELEIVFPMLMNPAI